eukprot:8894665-Pyramimonas_sp.AAC.1
MAAAVSAEDGSADGDDEDDDEDDDDVSACAGRMCYMFGLSLRPMVHCVLYSRPSGLKLKRQERTLDDNNTFQGRHTRLADRDPPTLSGWIAGSLSSGQRPISHDVCPEPAPWEVKCKCLCPEATVPPPFLAAA